MLTPNVLITNFCNQKCEFCFAKKLMTKGSMPREMSLNNFKSVVIKIKRSDEKNKGIKLLGGEPTLHSQFESIIEYADKNFSYITIFTNGIYSDRVATFMEKYCPKISLIFNVTTPGFMMNQNIRKTVIKRIKQASSLTNITLSLTINFETDLQKTLELISNEVIKEVDYFRIGLSNPIAGGTNYYKFQDFHKLGRKLCRFIKEIKAINSKIELFLNCGFTRCMFTDAEFMCIKKNVLNFLGFGCLGKASLLDIRTDMRIIQCYALCDLHSLNISRYSLERIDNYYRMSKYVYINKFTLDKCKRCKYFGYGSDRCIGPCIAFKLNYLQNQTSKSLSTCSYK